MKSLLDIGQLNKDDINRLLDRAIKIKKIILEKEKRELLLRGKIITTLFYEPSTRTRASFEIAGKILGADVVHLPVDYSAVLKGESFLDTLRTLNSMPIDCLIIRHPKSGASYFVDKHIDIPVINAGDGSYAHPTQALGDLFTLWEVFGDLKGLRVTIVGDILHSRVARSSVQALIEMGCNVKLCGPEELLPKNHFNYGEVITTSTDDALIGADVVMALRIQNERLGETEKLNLDSYITNYQINRNNLRYAKLMHPGPINHGIEIETGLIKDERSLVERQVSNGLFMKMAILLEYLREGS